MGGEVLTIALPKGKLFAPAVEILQKAGLECSGLDDDSRRLLFERAGDTVRYIISRPTDVPTYVECGAADLGIVGKDSLVEQQKDVYELVDLKFGCCRFVVAMPRKKLPPGWRPESEGGKPLDLSQFSGVRVATKFPRVAENYFSSRGIQAEIIKLHGNMELAPAVGLAEMIVDIVSTGRTLAENDLVPVAEIFQATARLIANRVSFRLQNERLGPLVDRIKELVGSGQSGKNGSGVLPFAGAGVAASGNAGR